MIGKDQTRTGLEQCVSRPRRLGQHQASVLCFLVMPRNTLAKTLHIPRITKAAESGEGPDSKAMADEAANGRL
eukprot:s1182_g2.t1